MSVSGEGDTEKHVDAEAGFPFDEWARTNGLDRKTTAKLRSHDCTTKAAVVLMSRDDVHELGLTLGQRNLLLHAVQKLRQPTPEAETMGESTQTTTPPGSGEHPGPSTSGAAGLQRGSAGAASSQANATSHSGSPITPNQQSTTTPMDQILASLQAGVQQAASATTGIENSDLLMNLGITGPSSGTNNINLLTISEQT